jgi:type I restriction enzyme S subunit
MFAEKSLSKISIIIMGTSPKGGTYNKENLGTPLLNGPTEFGQIYPKCTLFTTDSKKECLKDDLIFCVRGSTTGKMNFADQVYSLGRGVCSIRGNTKLDTRFINTALITN